MRIFEKKKCRCSSLIFVSLFLVAYLKKDLPKICTLYMYFIIILTTYIFTKQHSCMTYIFRSRGLYLVLTYIIRSKLVSIVLCHNPSITRSTGSRFTWPEQRSNRSQHKTNGALVHNNSSVIQLLLYDVITTLANNQPTN